MSRGTEVSKFRHKYAKRNEGDFPDSLNLSLRKEWDLKYGENPHQSAAIYSMERVGDYDVGVFSRLTDLKSVRTDDQGKGGLSLTNTMDISRAMGVLGFYIDPAVVIMKHGNISGFARQSKGRTLTDLFRLARDADRQSNFGGTAVFNRPLDMEVANALYELRGTSPFFVDVLAAPGYEEGVVGYVESQSINVRIGTFSNLDVLPKFVGDDPQGLISIKEMPGGRVGIQSVYLTAISDASKMIYDPMIIDESGVKHVVDRDPTKSEGKDLLTAWYLNLAGARSNGVIAVRDGVTVAVGVGKVERVGAVRDMIITGMQKAMDREGITYNPLEGIKGYEKLQDQPFIGAAVSSDGYFPFRDSIDLLAGVGVSAVVQPGGSKKDFEVIDAVNEHNMAMAFTLERCFGHF